MPFMETSAKTGLNVELAFLAVARYGIDKIDEPLKEQSSKLHF